MFRDIGPMEIVLILAVLVLLFGAKKLPELARGSGRALRIFKAETKGLMDDDDEEKTPEQVEVERRNAEAARLAAEPTAIPPTAPVVPPVPPTVAPDVVDAELHPEPRPGTRSAD